MWFLDFFKKEEKTSNRILSTSFGNIFIQEQVSLDVYFWFYRTNPFVKAVVWKLIKSVWKNWFQILDKNKKEVENVDFKNLLKFQFKTESAFIKKILRDYFIAWNSYVYKVRDKNDNIVWLQVLDPRYIKPITNSVWEVLGYVQNIKWKEYFTVDEINHLKYDYDLNNEAVWLPIMTSLYYDLESDKEARESNLAFFKNNQTPASLVVLDKDITDVKQLKQIKDLFVWWQFKGWKNRHRWWIVTGVKEIIPVQDKIDDMQFLNLRKFTLEVICSIFWVNKTVLNFTDGVNYSNSESQVKDFKEETIIPNDIILWEFLTIIYQDIYKTDEVIRYIAVKDNTDKAIKLFEKWVIKRDEARELVQYEPIWWKDWDYFVKDNKEAETKKD